MFHLDIAIVDRSGCCKTCMLQNVCLKCFRCFRRMYQVFHLDVAEVIWMFHNMHVANVCFQCFMRMLQLFHLNVAYVLQ